MKPRLLLQKHPLAVYFCAALLISWGSGAAILLPGLIQGKRIQPAQALTLFPIIVVGVGLLGVLLTGLLEGRSGVRRLFARMGRWWIRGYWYAVLLLPPGLILLVLTSFKSFLSPVFTPNFFPLGIIFGLFPGLVEELGWTGFALPRMLSGRSLLLTSLLLGAFWGIWHLPVVDGLGAASPHGVYWLPFFLAFIAVVMAVRVLIVWVYAHIQSLLFAQLIHAVSTGSLVDFGPAHVTPAQEALWYAVYALVLWITVGIVLLGDRGTFKSFSGDRHLLDKNGE